MTRTTRPPARPADLAFEQQLREMNEALLLSAVRQQELTEQVEKALAVVRESEERYHALFDLVPVAVYYCVSSGVIQNFNRRAAELWGREPALMDTDERFSGSFKLFRPDGSFMPHDQSPMAEVLSGKIAGVRDTEVVIERPDGSRISVVVNIHPLKNQRGEVTGAINCFYDITDRKQAEAANATLAAIIQSSDDAIISKTLDGIITSWNKSAERMFGYTEAEAVGQSTDFIVPEERRLEEDDVLACLRRGEKIENFQTDRHTKNGPRLDISLTVSPIKTAAGQTIGVSTIARDITEEKRVQDALWESEHRLRFVMDSAPQKIFTAQPDGNVDYFNPQWTEFTGLSFEQIKGWGWKQFIHPADLDENVRVWRHSIDTGEPFQFEHRFRRTDGEYRWHVGRAMPMRDEEGQITMWVGSDTDVHDIKLVEAVLEEQAIELSDLHRRKDEFLAMLSHELRSPLAPISNAVQLLGLQQGSESPLQQQARGIIERQLGQLQHLVDDLLEVSRITSGRIQLRRERVVVNRIMAGAVETVRPMIEQRRQELTVSLPPKPIWLNADAARLQQVVTNLLINASKYTSEGGHIWLTVELVSGTALAAGSSPETSPPRPDTTPAASAVPLTGSEVVIRIRDTGVGISPELLPHIFDLFTQAERSLDRSQGGLGIGLALVQRLTELHGGTVEATSELGQGSEFIVRLPLLSDEGRVASGEHASLLTPHPSPLAPPLKVLVVDDNVDTVLSLSLLLRAAGHDVQSAHDGPMAVQVALEYRPDVVLLDIGLPGLDGYEVAKRIRQQSVHKNVILVAVTGYGQEADRQTSLAAGFNHHLVKPPDFRNVQQILAIAAEKAK